jgi:hypothetical protein
LPDMVVVGNRDGGFGAVWAIDLLDLESLLGDRAGMVKKRRVWVRGIVV